MPSPSPAAELLGALSGALEDLGIAWYVFGAQAVLQWGRPRFTEDIDVTVQADSIETAAIVDALERRGFRLRVEGTPAFIAHTRVVPFEFSRSGWALDLVLGGPGLEEAFLERSIPTEIQPGLIVRVISPEDLIVTKVLAGRPKDLDDVSGVLLAQGEALDRRAVRERLAMLEDALGVSDLIPTFERLAEDTHRPS